jgi:hypothetical protein
MIETKPFNDKKVLGETNDDDDNPYMYKKHFKTHKERFLNIIRKQDDSTTNSERWTSQPLEKQLIDNAIAEKLIGGRTFGSPYEKDVTKPENLKFIGIKSGRTITRKKKPTKSKSKRKSSKKKGCGCK